VVLRCVVSNEVANPYLKVETRIELLKRLRDIYSYIRAVYPQ
jgi:hypothetical protein